MVAGSPALRWNKGALMGARLNDKVAIVTGAARGQGEAMARLFISEGARVVCADILDDLGAAVAQRLGTSALYTHLDISDEVGWGTTVRLTEDRFGPVNVLVNNAGIVDMGPLVETSLDRYLQVIRVNQVGCFLGMRAVVGSMSGVTGGSIVNTASMNGIVGYPGTIAYTASKAAIRGMTKAAAMELGTLGIRVNSIHPGAVDTEMIRPASSADLPTEEQQAAIYSSLPMRRPADAIEIAALALFLASDASSYSTGGEFVIDGGMLAGPPS